MASNTANGKSVETNFAAGVFNLLATTHPTENVIISPLLLEATLALLYLGSDGSTAEELQRAAQLQRFTNNIKMANYYASNLDAVTQATETRVQLCNRILLNEPYAVGEEFAKIAQKYFQTAAEKCDLNNAENLRLHLTAALPSAQMATSESMAASVMEQLTADAALVLTAAHFKNKWFLPFSAYRSGIYEFHMQNTATGTDDDAVPAVQKQVPMLFDDDMFVKFGEFRELDARAIELPYETDDDELAMLLLLPNKRDGLGQLEQQLSAVDLTALTERMQMESVQVLLPKFNIDFECGLRPYLEKLGIATIFSTSANFKNLVSENTNGNLHVSDVLHRVALEVNESGSEASSVVAYKPIVISNSIESRQKFFRADHPFYFAIRSRDVTYFVGHVTKF